MQRRVWIKFASIASIGLKALFGGVFGSIAFAAAPPDTSKRLNQLVTTCLACHATDNMRLDPAYPVPKIGMQHADYFIGAMKAYKSGERNNVLMKAQVATLSEKDILALANYFSDESVSGRLQPPIPPESTPAKWAMVCGACHGETGLGNMPGYPVLSGQYYDYLLHALNDYRNGNRKHVFMPIYAKQLSDAEMKEIAAYLSGRTNPTLILGIAPIEKALGSVRNAMLDVAGGEYVMGTNAGNAFNIGRPEHKVEIKPFRIAKYAVTFAQYDAFAVDTGRVKPSDEGWGRGNRPVLNVNWKDTQAFIAWLNIKSGKKYRLPTEAEREYAARAGTSTNFWWGDTLDHEYVNSSGVKGRDQWINTAPVGQFPANAYGLHDMSGNVWERTADCWHGNYEGAPNDGSAWATVGCTEHVIRGGYWGIPNTGHYSRYRAIASDADATSGLGFRLAEDAK